MVEDDEKYALATQQCSLNHINAIVLFIHPQSLTSVVKVPVGVWGEAADRRIFQAV